MLTFINDYAVEIQFVLNILGYGTLIIAFIVLLAVVAFKYGTAYPAYLRFERIAPEQFLADEKLSAYHKDMSAAGFQMWQAAQGNCHNPKTQVQIGFYRHPNFPSIVGTTNHICQTDSGKYSYFIEFFEQYADGSSLSVGDMAYAALPFIPNLAAYAVPGHTAKELFRLHQAVRRKTKPASPVIPDAEADYAAATVIPWLSKQRQCLTKMGMVQANPYIDGRYYYSFKGAAAVVWRSLPLIRKYYVGRSRKNAFSAAE